MTMDVRFELLWPEFLVAGLAFLVFALDFVIRPARKDILRGSPWPASPPSSPSPCPSC